MGRGKWGKEGAKAGVGSVERKIPAVSNEWAALNENDRLGSTVGPRRIRRDCYHGGAFLPVSFTHSPFPTAPVPGFGLSLATRAVKVWSFGLNEILL
jgi:hypothetical protein